MGFSLVRGGRFVGLLFIVSLLCPAFTYAAGQARLPERDDAPAEATVSESSGALGYSVKIDVPPGPGGLVPKLSVNYSSHAGDGLAGIGWDVSTSMIECSRRFGVPDFANCVQFELDGELLVGATGEGAGVTRYHTLNESFNRIRQLADGSWEVTTKDGTRREYGTNAESRVDHGTATAQWYLARTVDVFGNEITYGYKRFDWSDGVPYLEVVSYAGAHRAVVFKYESRSDVHETYVGGLRRFVAKRLSDAIVYSGETAYDVATPSVGINYRLEFGYGAPGEYSTERSRLTSVTRYGMDCTTSTQRPSEAGCVGLPPRTFEYTDLPESVPAQYEVVTSAPLPDPVVDAVRSSLAESHGQVFPDSHGAAWADINGDGLEDLVMADCPSPCFGGDGLYQVYLGNGSGIDEISNTDWAEALRGLRYDSPSLKLMQAPLYSNEFAGAEGSPYCVIEPSTFESGVYLGNLADYTTPPQPISIEDHPDPNMGAKIREFAPSGNFRLADVDGDARADLILSTRIGGVWKKMGDDDCHGVYGWPDPIDSLPEPNPSEFFMEDAQIVFLNQGPP